MIIRFILSCTWLCFVTISFAQLTIHVTSVPASTPDNAMIFIAGNFNSWNPGHAASELTDNGDDTYSITFSPPPGLIEYKFTRGSWSTVEGNSSGGFIPNRTYTYTGGSQVIHVTIEGWEDASGQHTAEPNVSVIDEDFEMPQLGRTRRIWIYLPPDYDSTTKRYPVLYMHDGQNLFDAFYSFAGEWKVDESLNALFDDGDDGIIVVGIDNGGGQRINEYSAWVNPQYGGGNGERYADFLVETLKPFIDSNYRTLPDRAHTGIAGSSLGANISLYTGIEHRNVFSKIGLFSPAFWFSDSIYMHVAGKQIKENMRIYFVAGDNESGSMVPDMMQMFSQLTNAGVDAADMVLVHHADGAHSEWYWAREFGDAYLWLFDDEVSGLGQLKVVKDFIYPNPADKHLRISLEGALLSYRIYSSMGNVLQSARMVHDTIDISTLPPGFYLLKVWASGHETYISRFVKK